MVALPPELKHLGTIEARAKELEDVEPAVSYWARYWIVQKSIASQKEQRSSVVEEYLMSVLEQLERMKGKHAGMAELDSMAAGRTKVEGFALQIFDNADREEKAKRATKTTVNKFLAAATFLEVCQVFGTPEKDLIDKRKYAKVQAMRIQTAFAAGKDPNAGKSKAVDVQETNPTAEESAELDALLQSSAPISDSKLDDKHSVTAVPATDEDMLDPHASLPVSRPASPEASSSDHANPLPVAATPTDDTEGYFDEVQQQDDLSAPVFPDVPITPPVVAKSPTPPVPVPASPPAALSSIPDQDTIAAAQKHAKWAISALNYDDITTAVSELQKALSTLGAR